MTMTARQKVELARQIATELGGTLAEEVTGVLDEVQAGADVRVTIKLPEHEWAAINLRFDGWKREGRLSATLSWPTRPGYGTTTPVYYLNRRVLDTLGLSCEITVSYMREAEAIVREMKRRLLPDYIRALELMKVASDAKDVHEAELDTIYRELSEIVGCTLYREGPLQGRTRRGFRDGDVEGEVQHDARVELKLRALPAPLAKQILMIVRASGHIGRN